jgi:hypothetical protein
LLHGRHGVTHLNTLRIHEVFCDATSTGQSELFRQVECYLAKQRGVLIDNIAVVGKIGCTVKDLQRYV